LKVCYRGTARQVQRLKAATEQATESTITLERESDGRQCISGMEVSGKSKTLEYARLEEMVGSEAADITVAFHPGLWGGRQSYAQHALGGRVGRLLITPHEPLAYPTRWFGSGPCWGSASGTLPAVIAHELIGHIYHQTVARPGVDSGEPYAIAWENRYHARAKEPLRCSH
jgi:hypothetical protein